MHEKSRDSEDKIGPKGLKLSEAIRAGAKLRPKGTGNRSANPAISDTLCVLGAAALGEGLDVSPIGLQGEINYDKFRRHWPILKESVVDPPISFKPGVKLIELLWMMNDCYPEAYTRETIADYIEQAEAEYEECHGPGSANGKV